MFLLFLPLLLFLFFANVVTLSFTKLGLTPASAFLLFLMSLLGSLINIPISKRRVAAPTQWHRYIYWQPNRYVQQSIAINVGGCLLPTLFSFWLLLTQRAPLAPALVATAGVTALCYLLSRPVPGQGIRLPALIPPLVAALLAWLLARDMAGPVAYVSGSLGTLIGADLLHWRLFQRLGYGTLSIGGAGVFDGIFLVGIVAAFLT